jgi:WD40 repeat protein
VRNRRSLIGGSVAGLLVLFGVLAGIPVNVVSGYLPGAVTGHRVLWIVLLAGASSAMVGLTWLSGRVSEHARRVPLPAVTAQSEWVDREQAREVVELLTARHARAVGITAMTGLAGAGGFGKTTLAEMVRADPRIRRRFAGGSVRLTVGQGVRGAALALKINDVAGRLSGDRPGYSDPEIAGQHLMGLLDTGPWRLLVVDDVWSAEQLVPFRAGGSRCALLVTTRIPDLLPGDARKVLVDQMSGDQARQMLRDKNFALPAAIVEDLLRVTGRWPLLISLVAARLRKVAAEPDGDALAAAQLTVDQITRYGPAALDVTVGNDRTRAVSVSLGLSLDMLPPGAQERFAELAIFSAETAVPARVIARLWAVTAGLSENDSHALCRAMGQLSLLRYRADSDSIEMHEVIRAYMQTTVSTALPDIHAALLDGLAEAFPISGSPVSGGEPVALAWWQLPVDQDYLWDNLARHIAASRLGQFDRAITDLRWVSARLVRSGPAAALADLARDTTVRAVALRRELTRIEHLLAPTVPARCVSDVLLSRLRDDSTWHDEVDHMQAAITEPHLINSWPLPDVPDEQLRQTLEGHEHWVTAVAIAPDGTWLASGSLDGTVGIWDAATGRRRTVLTGHKRGVEKVAISPDGSWVACTDGTTAVYLWDVARERLRTTFDTVLDETQRHYPSPVTSLALSPDGTWLSTVAGTVSQWNVATGQLRTPQAGGPYIANSVAVSPDGHWLATASQNVHIWDTATGDEHHTIVTDHQDEVTSVTFSPDGTWLATAGGYDDRQVRAWDAASGQLRFSVLTDHSGVSSVVIAPGGRWFATVGTDFTIKGKLDNTIQLWDAETGEHIITLGGESLKVLSVAISPDETWLAAGDRDGSIRIWDLADMSQSATRTYGIALFRPVVISPDATWLAGTRDNQHIIRVCEILSGRIRHAISRPQLSVSRMVVAPDGAWFATAWDTKIWIWSPGTGRCRFWYSCEDTGPVQEMAASPSSDWIATGHWKGMVSIWDINTNESRIIFPVHADREQFTENRVTSLVIAPNGTWLATSIYLDSSVRVWDTATGELRHTLTCQRAAGIVAIAPNGEWLAVAAKGTVQIWNAVSGNLQATLNVFDEESPATYFNSFGLTDPGDLNGIRLDEVTSIAISPDSTWIATTASEDSRIKIWNCATGQPRAKVQAGNGALKAVAVSPDGAWLAAIGGGPVFTDAHTVTMWSTVTWKCVASTRVNGRLDRCSWTPDGRYVVLNGAYGTYLFEFFPENKQHNTKHAP